MRCDEWRTPTQVVLHFFALQRTELGRRDIYYSSRKGEIVMLKLNLRILRTFNSCDRREFFALLDEVHKIPGIFTRKRYLWNWFRPRDFYKMIADYVIEKMKTKEPENFQIAEDMIKVIMATTKNSKIKQSFVWNITKRCPILTIEMLPYISKDRIKSILYSNAMIYTDEYLSIFVREIVDLRKRLPDRC